MPREKRVKSPPLPPFELPAIPPEISALMAVADGADALRALSALISLLRNTGVTEYSTPELTLKLGDPPKQPAVATKPVAHQMDAVDLALSFGDSKGLGLDGD